MTNRTRLIAIAALAALVVGAAVGFFELIILGVLGAIATVALAVRDRRQPA